MQMQMQMQMQAAEELPTQLLDCVNQESASLLLDSIAGGITFGDSALSYGDSLRHMSRNFPVSSEPERDDALDGIRKRKRSLSFDF